MPRPKLLRCCLFWQEQGYSYCVACMYSNAGWSAHRRRQNAEDNRALAGERLAKELAKGPKCRICKRPLAVPEGQYGSVHRICTRPDTAEQIEEKHWTDWTPDHDPEEISGRCARCHVPIPTEDMICSECDDGEHKVLDMKSEV